MNVDEYKPPICKLAKFLYKKDIVCGLECSFDGEACPLDNETCPLLILQDAGDFSYEAMEKLMIDYLKRQK